MKRLVIIVTYCLLTVCCICLLPTCAKEYSYEGGNQPPPPTGNPSTSANASFTLEGDPTECTIALPAGNFIAGSSNSTNTFAISVNVSKTGDYNISTDTLDNIILQQVAILQGQVYKT